MIFPLATKSSYGLDSSESEESVHNCYVEMNEEDSETEVSIRFREGIKKVDDTTVNTNDYIASQNGIFKTNFSMLTKKGVRVFNLSTGSIEFTIDFDQPITTNGGYGDIEEVIGGNYVVANAGNLLYVDHGGIEEYTESFLATATAVVLLRGYLIVAAKGKLYISDFQEYKVFRPLSFIDVGKLVTAMIVYNDELWLFTIDGVQVYTLSGGTTVAMAPVVGAHYEYETQNPFPIIHDESLYFIDRYYNIYRVDGYSFKKIIPPGIKRLISSEGEAGNRHELDDGSFVIIRKYSPRIYIERVKSRNFSSLCVVFGRGAQIAAMNMDNGLWRTESFNTDTWEDYDNNSAGSQRNIVYGVHNHIIMEDGVYQRDNKYSTDNGDAIMYKIRSPVFHRERELRRIRMIGFNFGHSSYTRLAKTVAVKLEVHKADQASAIVREFTLDQRESQRNRQYNLGSSRSMSVSLEINGGTSGIPIGALVLSGAEVQ